MKGRIFVIGASLSGIDALTELMSKLPAGFPAPIFVAQHVASHSPGMLPYLLSKAGPLPAAHPQNATVFEAGTVYVAPPEATLSKRLRDEPLFAEDAYTATSLDDRAGSLGSQANTVSEWLHAMSGLVEPEPSMNRLAKP